MEDEQLVVTGKRKVKKKKKVCKSIDEVDFEYRKATVGFMQKVGKNLQVPIFTVATACHFFHVFYNRYDFSDHDRMDVAATCVFLACKVEESPMKLAVVLKECQTIQKEKLGRGKVMKEGSDEFELMRKKILALERAILDVIDFNLKIDHPYNTFVTIVKPMKDLLGKEHSSKLAQKGWNFINDSYLTTICLDYTPQDIAICCFYLAENYLENVMKVKFDKKPSFFLEKFLKENSEKIKYKVENIPRIRLRMSPLFEKSMEIKKK